MKYCDKFYEVSEDIKVILTKEGRQSWLVGQNNSPFGPIPSAIYYTGSVIPEIHKHCIGMSILLSQKMYPTEQESCCGFANVDPDDTDGGIFWEK